MTTRHEFLAQLHELLKPKVYLEIGVQHGWSLQLSKAAMSFGIDPNPLLQNRGHHKIYEMTSDLFFDMETGWDDDITSPIDLAFIDGMHLAEFAWRDFLNVAKYCHAGSVVVFDDVLPTTQEMAAREQCPGDWTGDVWKVYYRLREYTDLVLALTDTTPTGTLVVTGFDLNEIQCATWAGLEDHAYPLDIPYPPQDQVLDRRHAWSASAVLENLKDRGFGA